MEDKDFEYKYAEMHVDEMKAVKDSWKRYFKMAQHNLKHIQCIEETKDNRWELKSLEMNYTFFIDQINQIIKIYSKLINMAENCELDEEDFLYAMKQIQLINKDLKAEYGKKSFKALNIKFIEGIRTAKNLTL